MVLICYCILQTPALIDESFNHGNFFSASTGFPVSFGDSLNDSSSVDIMDMSAGDLVSVGGPTVCPWDGTSSISQHSTPSFPKSSMEERFAADLNVDSAAQHEDVAVAAADAGITAQRGQVAVTEQASQTGSPTEHSRHALNSNGSLLSMRSVGQKRNLATLNELAGLLLPQSCRVAARVSTKLPPLDHDPMLPPLPEGFILPPEMHPVVGACTKAMTATTGSQTAAEWSPADMGAAADMNMHGHVQQEGKRSGKWVHPKQAPPTPKAW